MKLIIMVDDHKIVREGIQKLLNKERVFNVVKTLGGIREMFNYLEDHVVDLVLLDLKLLDGDGVSASLQLKKRFPRIKIILLSGYIEPELAYEATRIGIEGYLHKSIELDKLIATIKRVLSGEKYYDEAVLQAFEKEVPEKLLKLSSQELHIIKWLALGKTNKEIASEMELAEKTARNYISRLYKKIHVTNRTEAVAYYMRHSAEYDNRVK